jgi:hypothetical protein
VSQLRSTPASTDYPPAALAWSIWGLGAAVAAAGTLIFAMAPTILLSNCGRLLIGGSVAVAFVGMIKLASHWFVPRQFALATGMALLSGIIGGVFAGVPLRVLVTEFG